jgi:hypothetical protein
MRKTISMAIATTGIVTAAAACPLSYYAGQIFP